MEKGIFIPALILILAFSAYLLLDTFVLESAVRTLSVEEEPEEAIPAEERAEAVVTENSYQSENLTVTLTEYEYCDTTVYAARVSFEDPGVLKTAFARSTYGRNITETTSIIAGRVDAILAVNGDYYGAQERGYVLRNGVLYRSTPAAGREDLVIWADGSFSIITETEVSAESLLEQGAVQILSFGPALVENGEVAVTAGEEVGRAKSSNPRTAIGVTADGDYLFVVSDGRTSASEGLSLSELAAFLKDLGAETAYNLDGGGSSTMVFMGKVINNPTTTGRTIQERKISDVVYIG